MWQLSEMSVELTDFELLMQTNFRKTLVDVNVSKLKYVYPIGPNKLSCILNVFF